jgi:7,8-dihydropterin-6-yl-methyl-4-(beta-D-ribofuranosyl)aminobenzene 5'-phosphate synthase
MLIIKRIIIALFVMSLWALPLLAQDILKAAQQGDIDTVKKLLNKNPDLLKTKDENGITPMHVAANGGHKEIIELLLSKGADANIKDNNGRTPLFFAAGNGSIDICTLLIEKGAQVNVANKYDRTPLLYAIWRNHKDLAEFLIDKAAEINFKDTDGYTPLHYVSMEGQKDIADMLISKGVDILVTDNSGHTPLHMAAYYGQSAIVELLVTKGVDINIKDKGDDTPLHGAAWNGNKETVELLINKGAEVNAKNNDGKTPLDYALKAGHKEAADFLMAKGAVSSSKGKKIIKSTPIINKTDQGEKNTIIMTILYDNYLAVEGTKTEWGFSCFIEGAEKTILFDTGGDSKILMHNINYLNIDLSKVDQIVISHNHWDHIGGLTAVLEKIPNKPVYLPYSVPYDSIRRTEIAGGNVVPVNEPVEICKHVFLTGEMGDQIKEQSLIVNTPKGMVIVTGCSHPGIVNILKRAKEILDRDIYLVFGGFHLMQHSDEQVKAIIEDFKKLGVVKCGASHCTGDRQIALFKEAFGENYVPIGTGKVLQITEEGIK